MKYGKKIGVNKARNVALLSLLGWKKQEVKIKIKYTLKP